jgi:protein-S-isoprenylcysteine O-methyltransferase Ste14
MVLTRIAMLRRRGIMAMKFGETDKSDFIIPPFALFYIYLVLANAFGWPAPVHTRLFLAPLLAWVGVLCCAIAVTVMASSLIAFGTSFRIGIDTDRPDKLITSGIFAVTRNPIYVAFIFALIGEFLIAPTWLMLIYLVAGFALLHRQVLREEAFLRAHYGAEFQAYASRVRRYL